MSRVSRKSQDLSADCVKLESSGLVPELYCFSNWSELNKERSREKDITGQEKAYSMPETNRMTGVESEILEWM